MSRLTGLNAIVIDSDAAARMRIKQATRAVPLFKDVLLLPNLDSVQTKTGSETEYNVIFLTERLPEDELLNYIKAAKEQPQTQDAAFILVFNCSCDAEKRAAESLLTGFDGCLMEPYSVDALTEITELAAKVKKERTEEREKAVVEVLIKDIMAHVDRLAYVKSCKVDVTNVLKKLRKNNTVFSTFGEDTLNIYYKVAIELLGQGSAKQIGKDKKQYQGSSDRIRKRMAEKILAEEMKKLR